MHMLHTPQAVRDIARVTEDLSLLVASGDRVRIGYTTTTGKTTKTDSMTAADAVLYIDATIDVLSTFDIGLASLIIWRQD